VAPPPVLRLVRWPGTLTAAADATAGSLLLFCTPGTTAAVAAAAALVYAGGVVLNDAADAERDRTLHPSRPIASGAVSRGVAVRFGAALLAAGVGAAALAGTPALLGYAAVAGLAVAYDFLLKRWGLAGALAMGLCRGGSVLAAMASSPSFPVESPGRLLLVPLLFLLHGFAVTAASLLEESPRARSLLPAAAAGVLLPTALCFGWSRGAEGAGVALALCASALLTFALGRALASERAAPGVVREGVFGFLLLDAALLGVRGLAAPAAAALALWAGLRAILRAKRS
jgi:4-hydroxybenzoate polyprenyltransferase